MLDILFWIAVGMVIGWNLLPQPAWVEELYNRAYEMIFSDKEDK
jgi:hypothetical protein